MSELNRAVSFTLSSQFLSITNLICGIFIYRLVPPTQMGIWQAMVLIQTYLGVFAFGVFSGLNRELPFSIGEGNKEETRHIAEMAKHYSVCVGLLLFFAMVIYLFIINEDGFEWKFAYTALALIISVSFYQSYLLGIYRSYNNFSQLSSMQYVESFINSISLIFVIYYGFTGYCIRAVGVVFFMTGLAYIFRPLRIKPHFRFPILIKLLKTGLPIYIGSYLYAVANGIPRLILLKYGSIELLGIFAPFMTILGALSVLTSSMTMYYYPKISKMLGETPHNKLPIWRRSIKIHIIGGLISIPIFVIGTPLIPWFVTKFLPKYIECIEILPVALFTALFLGFQFGFSVLVTLKAWKYMAVFIFSFFCFQFLAPVVLLNWYNPLLAVAYGQLASAILMSIVSLYTNYCACKKV